MTDVLFRLSQSFAVSLPGMDPLSFVFHRPEWLLALLLLPFWWLLVWPWAGHGLVHSRGEWMRTAVGGGSRLRLFIPLLPRMLRSLVLIALVFALSAPHQIQEYEELSTVGRGISLIVDLSSSMLARDMDGGASRIEVAREAAIRFAESRPDDEQSLVGFAAQALTRVPPTTDPALIVAGVTSLEPQLIRDGTDISMAVLTATARLLESEREPRVAILLTDGAHNGTSVPPLTAARAAAEAGIRVHSISILPPEDPNRPWPTAGRARLADEMRTVLQGISEITGGEYFHASSGVELDSAYARISRTEGPILDVTEHEERTPVAIWFLAIALLFLGTEGLVRGSRLGVVP